MWASAGPYGSHLLTSYYAIKVYGPGHVIAHNAIAYFHDAIGISTYGTPEKDPERQASSIDIYNNDMHMSNDDFVETDGGVHNVRVFNNRGVNAAHGGYSSQPVFGGPVYFIRNILYHVPTGVAFKFSAKPAGLFVYHNTIIGEQAVRDPSSNMHFRNNLFLGRDTPGRGIMTWANATDAYSSDYNGFRPNKGVAEQYTWLAPKPGQQPVRAEAGQTGRSSRRWPTSARRRGRKSTASKSISTSSRNWSPPDPAKRHAVYHAMDLNFRLKARQQGGGRRRPDSDRERRLHRPRPGPGRAGSRQARAAVRAALAHLAAVLPVVAAAAAEPPESAAVHPAANPNIHEFFMPFL